MSNKPAAAAAAASSSSLSVEIGAKRSNEKDEKKSHDPSKKKSARYNYCCTNPWTKRCELLDSSNEMSITERESKCYPTESACQEQCKVSGLAEIPPLFDLVLQYNNLLILQDAFDIKSTDPILNKPGRIFANRTAAEILEQKQQSTQLTVLLDQLESLRSQGALLSDMKKMYEEIRKTLIALQGAVTKSQVIRIVDIYDDIANMFQHTWSLLEQIRQYEHIERLDHNAITFSMSIEFKKIWASLVVLLPKDAFLMVLLSRRLFRFVHVPHQFHVELSLYVNLINGLLIPEFPIDEYLKEFESSDIINVLGMSSRIIFKFAATQKQNVCDFIRNRTSTFHILWYLLLEFSS